jgi:hypothetical protein
VFGALAVAREPCVIPAKNVAPSAPIAFSISSSFLQNTVEN